WRAAVTVTSATSRPWSVSYCRRPPSAAPTRPMRWPSPSVTPATARPRWQLRGARAWRRCADVIRRRGRPGPTGPAGEHGGGAGMIGKLKGMVDAVGEGHAIVDVGGVGYEVQASARTLRALEAGQPVSLAIETHVREDAIRLFGFTSEVERAWFRLLQTVQGVGAKVALAVLGTLAPQDLASAIALQNWAAVEQTPGVGKKLSQRIVAELRDKAPALSVAGLNVPTPARKGAAAPVENSATAEAISALTNLGYQPAQASQAVAAAIAELGDAADTPKLIRRGLKELAR